MSTVGTFTSQSRQPCISQAHVLRCPVPPALDTLDPVSTCICIRIRPPKKKGTLHFTPSPSTLALPLSLSTTNDMLQIHSFLPREAFHSPLTRDSVNREYSYILHRRPDNSPTLAVPGAAPSGTPSTSILESAVRRSPGRSPTWLNHSRTHPPHLRAHTTLAAALPGQCLARRIPHLAICHSRHKTPDERSLVRG